MTLNHSEAPPSECAIWDDSSTGGTLSKFGSLLTCPAPHLAAELWLDVFDLATWIPGAYTLDHDSVAAFTRDAHGISASNRHRNSMDMKLSLSLVCKRWHRLIQPSMHDYLRVTSGSHAIEVAAVMTSHSDSDGYSPGKHTKRFEIALDGIHDWEDRHTQALIDILQACPNLLVFSTAFCTTDPNIFHTGAFSTAFSSVSARHTLERLELKGSTSLVNDMLLRVGSNLQALWIIPPRRCVELTGGVATSLPKLKVLISMFHAVPDFSIKWSMPQLESLLTVDFSDLHLRCAQRSGNALRQLSIPTLFVIPLLEHCPNLLEVIIKFDGANMTCRNMPSHPSLRRITVEHPNLLACCSRFSCDGDDEHRGHFAPGILSLDPTKFPALESIRLALPLSNVYYIDESLSKPRMSRVWHAWITRLSWAGVRILASHGADSWTADVWTDLDIDQYEVVELHGVTD